MNKDNVCNQVTGELCKNVLLIHVPCSRGKCQTNVNALTYCDENEEQQFHTNSLKYKHETQWMAGRVSFTYYCFSGTSSLEKMLQETLMSVYKMKKRHWEAFGVNQKEKYLSGISKVTKNTFSPVKI